VVIEFASGCLIWAQKAVDVAGFLVNTVPEPTAQVPMTVVVNWTAALKK
jgi:hypothetical protein